MLTTSLCACAASPADEAKGSPTDWSGGRWICMHRPLGMCLMRCVLRYSHSWFPAPTWSAIYHGRQLLTALGVAAVQHHLAKLAVLAVVQTSARISGAAARDEAHRLPKSASWRMSWCRLV